MPYPGPSESERSRKRDTQRLFAPVREAGDTESELRPIDPMLEARLDGLLSSVRLAEPPRGLNQAILARVAHRRRRMRTVRLIAIASSTLIVAIAMALGLSFLVTSLRATDPQMVESVGTAFAHLTAIPRAAFMGLQVVTRVTPGEPLVILIAWIAAAAGVCTLWLRALTGAQARGVPLSERAQYRAG